MLNNQKKSEAIKMEIEDLLEISSEIRDSIRTYISETADHGAVIKRRERDVTRKIGFRFFSHCIEFEPHNRY